MLQAMQRNSCNWPLQLRSPYWEYGHRWTLCLAKHQTHCTQLYRSSINFHQVNKKEGTEHFHAPKPVFLSVYTWNLELGRSSHFHDHHCSWSTMASSSLDVISRPVAPMATVPRPLSPWQSWSYTWTNCSTTELPTTTTTKTATTASDTATAAVVSFLSASPSYQDPKFVNVKRQWNKTTEAEATTITTFPKSSVYLSYLNQKKHLVKIKLGEFCYTKEPQCWPWPRSNGSKSGLVPQLVAEVQKRNNISTLPKTNIA